jgi:hypothetical protein
VYTKDKLVGKNSLFTGQIQSYVKNRCILGIQAKCIFNEICLLSSFDPVAFIFEHPSYISQFISMDADAHFPTFFLRELHNSYNE